MGMLHVFDLFFFRLIARRKGLMPSASLADEYFRFCFGF
jgi:hypothetical protein